MRVWGGAVAIFWRICRTGVSGSCDKKAWLPNSSNAARGNYRSGNPSFWRINSEKLIFPRILSTAAFSLSVNISMRARRFSPSSLGFLPAPLRAPPRLSFFSSFSILFFSFILPLKTGGHAPRGARGQVLA